MPYFPEVNCIRSMLKDQEKKKSPYRLHLIVILGVKHLRNFLCPHSDLYFHESNDFQQRNMRWISFSCAIVLFLKKYLIWCTLLYSDVNNCSTKTMATKHLCCRIYSVLQYIPQDFYIQYCTFLLNIKSYLISSHIQIYNDIFLKFD